MLVGAADGDVEAEFNKGFILPPLIVQLRKILDQYPDDTQILRVSTCIIDLPVSYTHLTLPTNREV